MTYPADGAMLVLMALLYAALMLYRPGVPHLSARSTKAVD